MTTSATSTPTVTLPDDTVRERIASDLDATLFVDAGAGSGKTTVLVRRIVALVDKGVPLRQIAAVTFTEKAASELRDRLRVGLEELGGEKAETALAELDGAAIGTLHSFARRILSEHPIEAGLPPLIDVLDEVASQVAADRRWNDLQTELLTDDDVAPLLRLGLAAGMTMEHLRELVAKLESDADLVAERLTDLDVPPPPSVNGADFVARARALATRRRECSNPGDRLLAKFPPLEEWIARADGVDDEAQLLDLLDEIPGAGKIGQKGNWHDVDAVRAEFASLSEDGVKAQRRIVDQVLRCLLPRLAAEVVESADQRVAAGALRFHDLLILARRLVRSSSDACRTLAGRYPRLLLDEAQDTDPIQVELAVRIAGADASTGSWRDVVVPPGSLFFVGDAKQSIYRFRRADIGTYLDARAALGDKLSLTTNFRSAPEVLDWVNGVFGARIQLDGRVQPAFEPLDVDPRRGPGVGSVTVLGATPHPSDRSFTAAQVRLAEAADIAALVTTALHEQWPVSEKRDGVWVERPLRPQDITILLPYRTTILTLEAALDEAGVPYRTEAASIVYSAPEVREVLTCLRAVDDPTDELAVVATLRSSLFGCSDPELWRWRAAGGRWSPFGELAEGPVGDALRCLRGWARERSGATPSELLESVLEQRRVLEVAVDSPRYQEVWRRLRFVVDQARAWSEAEHGSLREYLRWATRQAEDSARVTETVLPEDDAESVRITTIHASKGLEFPFVIVAGLATTGFPRRPLVLWPDDGGVEVQLSATVATAGYGQADVREKAIERAERLRLLYVACTRAETHLAVSVHRKGPPASAKPDRVESFAELLADDGFVSSAWSAQPFSPSVAAAAAPLPDWPVWSAAHWESVTSSKLYEAASATDIAHGRVSLPSFPGLLKDPVDLELPPWVKGRYGTAVGRAVHGVLQDVDLASGAGLEGLAASQVLAEGVLDALDDVVAVVRSALDSPVVQRAAACEHWREIYVGTVIDETLVEGYVDLLYRDDDGLVLVDYKTDTAVGGETISAYERQLEVYRRALVESVGEPVVRSVLLFPRPGGAVEHEVGA